MSQKPHCEAVEGIENRLGLHEPHALRNHESNCIECQAI
nr:hypothetical protein [uncultured bacterium]